MKSQLAPLAALTLALTVALGGCANNDGVQHAQITADQALGLAHNGIDTGVRAQGRADEAYAAATHAQGTADGAMQSVGAARREAHIAVAEVHRLSARVNRLERGERCLKRKRCIVRPHRWHHRRAR